MEEEQLGEEEEVVEQTGEKEEEPGDEATYLQIPETS